ncbi:hypothetical protein [Pseudomonas amygdali]|uniref:hypothetical protein n=1 Tax=Pseudomonas amygdali TaxID=47877 RepID=UPI0006B973C3|nr:hypothetical protein [Pseudomonas amygdali]KPY57620.1 Uncharacterized protein ALO93_02326 [Pseudomonas amygdali pv. sesami]RMT92081.1 hypothetical protein ALP38_200067 [Pseudomonas amygdali pv. sesami]RMT98240.1 hypothetical protein ALP37_200164 [Pseudomonas amygdali pv. sesami]RMV80823.1 hypothetical protein ALP04_02304 [Pseudomonas amygdali pv. sesami]
MSIARREYSALAEEGGPARKALAALLAARDDPSAYGRTMHDLGGMLGAYVAAAIPPSETCLLASTAEDADYLTKGIYDTLKADHLIKAAVFWNNHYNVAGGSIAPVVHKFLEPGYETSNTLVIAKAVISGSCVVRTNILELIEQIDVEKIYIVSPVMHEESEQALREEFSAAVADKFVFVYFVKDSLKEEGVIVPGIGGEIYGLLGLADQPARMGFMPQLVRQLAAF